MLKIRLSLGGAKKRPVYKIVIADSKFPRDGRFIEKVGFFNPLLPKTKKERVNLEVERIKHWISKGAKPTLRVSRILGEAQILPMPSKGNNPLKAIPKKDRKKDKIEADKPKTEAKKEAPKAAEPKTEAKKEAPKAAEPKTEAKKEAPKAVEPKTEAKKEAPKAVEPKTEAPKKK
jgi:small subunit ribosomal protein S16